MSDNVNHLANQLRKSSWFKASGPVMCGQKYSAEHGQDMIEQRFKVTNGTYIDEADVPFGSFVRIEEVNTKESWCIVLSTPYVDGGGSPVFRQRCGDVKNVDRWVCSGTECKQIVPAGTGVVNGWSGKITAIDAKHEQVTNITATGFATITKNPWDKELHQYVSVVETVVTAVVPDVTVDYVYVEHELIRCGYYLKRTVTWVATSYTETVYNLTEFIGEALITYNIDLEGSLPAIPASKVWEAGDRPLSRGAFVRRVVTVVGTPNVVTGSGFDDILNDEVEYTELLLDVEPVSGGYTGSNFVTWNEVKPGWWVKRSEAISTGLKHTIHETRNYYWPPVLTTASFTEIDALNEDGDSYVRRIAANFQLTDDYNGPCKASTTVKFLTANVAPTVDQLLTDGISHSGLLTKFSIPPCLHGQVVVTETISANHPLYEATTLVATYPATTLTAWPATVVSEVDVRPYKGGFIEYKTTITKPA